MSYRKQIFKLNNLKKLLVEENSCVSLMPTVRLLALPPFFLNDMKSGILYLLNNMLKKYDRSLGGIVIGYQNIKVLMDENTGIIPIGTSETEVNVSVEFYIFQPRIGSYLEGIVNKKSNNHIGCLVHQYFNATILKPDDIDYEDWICKNINVDDKIIFIVKDLDFTSLLPYIEGVIGGNKAILLDNDKSNNHINCDTNSLVNNLTKTSENEISLAGNFLKNKVILSEKSEDDFLEMKEDKFSNVKEILSDSIIVSRADKSHLNEKKKKKKKSSGFDKNDPEDITAFENIKCLSSSQMEDSVMYSTLLDSVQSEKMRLSFCSPISEGTPVKRKKNEFSSSEDLDSVVQINSQKEIDKKVKKKKQKKRKKEERESEIFPSPKKIETSHTFLSKKGVKKGDVTDDEDNSKMRTTVEELYKIHLNRVKELINMSNEGNYKEETKKKKLKKRDKEIIKNKILDVNRSAKVEINGADGIEKKSEAQSSLDELNKPDPERVEEELSVKDRQSFKESKRTKTKLKKKKKFFKEKMTEDLLKVNKISRSQKNATDQEDKNSEVQNILDELFKQEMKRVKDNFKKSGTNSFKEEKKVKAVVNKEEMLQEGSHLSLYEKLLKEAKSAVDLGRDKLPNSLPVKEFEKNKNKKDSDLSDLSISSSRKKDSKKKKKYNKEKAEHCHQSPDKYRNGSMYDATATPEKPNPDRSLFSDSEQSHTSPIKKVKDVNGTEKKLEKSLVQNMLGEFSKEERKRPENESDKESLVNLEKQEKKKRKFDLNLIEKKKSFSLYEKLLKEAKSLINSREQSLPKKKKK